MLPGTERLIPESNQSRTGLGRREAGSAPYEGAGYMGNGMCGVTAPSQAQIPEITVSRSVLTWVARDAVAARQLELRLDALLRTHDDRPRAESPIRTPNSAAM